MADYIPHRETEKLLWLTNFNDVMQVQGAGQSKSKQMIASANDECLHHSWMFVAAPISAMRKPQMTEQIIP